MKLLGSQDVDLHDPLIVQHHQNTNGVINGFVHENNNLEDEEEEEIDDDEDHALRRRRRSYRSVSYVQCPIYDITLILNIDPLGRPIIAACRDHYFHTDSVRPSVPTFKIK